MHACHNGSCLTPPSFFLGTATTGAQCLCHLLIAFSPTVELWFCAYAPRKKKKVRLPIWSWQVESSGSTSFCLRREWRAAAHLWKPGQTKEMSEGERKTNPLPLFAVLRLWESDIRLTEESHAAQLPVIEQGQHRAGGMDFQEDLLMPCTTENMQSKYTKMSHIHSHKVIRGLSMVLQICAHLSKYTNRLPIKPMNCQKL